MRSFPACTAILLATLLAPISTASLALPEDWRAKGEALWDDADAVCLGDLVAGSIGPMLAGEHAGDWWFWVDVSAREGNCAPLRREGWISSPYASRPQVLSSDEHGGSLVAFHRAEDGSRSLELFEWRTVDGQMVPTLDLVSALDESSLL